MSEITFNANLREKQVRGQLVHVVEKAVSLQLFTVAKKMPLTSVCTR